MGADKPGGDFAQGERDDKLILVAAEEYKQSVHSFGAKAFL